MSDRHHPKAATCFFHVVKSFATLSFSDDVIPGEIFSLAEKHGLRLLVGLRTKGPKVIGIIPGVG